MIGWTCSVLASLAAYLVTFKLRWWHLVGFSIWVCTNAYWTVYNFYKHEYALSFQFLMFLIPAIIGVIKNRKFAQEERAH